MMRWAGTLLVLSLGALVLGGCGGSEEGYTVSSFTIMPGVTGPTASAYNPNDDEYMVAARAGANIYGRIVSAIGEPLGNRITVATDSDLEGTPAVAHDSTSNRYLVVWTVGGAGAKVVGQFISANGVLEGAVTIWSASQPHEADVAYNSNGDSYLVCWRDDEVYVREVDGDGTVGASGTLGGSTASRTPQVAANPAAGDFLVAWHDTIGGVYGRLSPGGGSVININAVTAHSNNVAYAASADTYLAIWTDASSGNWDVWGQVINAAGSLVGSSEEISDHPSDEADLRLGVCPSQDYYLALWHVGSELAGRTVDTAGSPLSGILTVDFSTSGESMAASTTVAQALTAYGRSGDIRTRVIVVP